VNGELSHQHIARLEEFMSSTLVRFAVASVTSLTLTGVLLAQAPQTPPPQPPRTDQTTPQRGGDNVTLAGCLMQGKDVAALKTASPEDFFLTNAMPAGAATTSGAGTPGATTPATGTPPPSTAGGTRPSDAARAGGAMGGSGKTYRISGLDKDQLSKHVNHQIEIQGKVTPGGASGTPSATTPTPGAAAGAAASGASDLAGVIQATSVKMISATCTSKE
jgi:hypothetical protein